MSDHQDSDSGYGLRLHGCWLISTPSAARVRWLSAWNQAGLCVTWNAVVAVLRWLRPRDISGRWLAAYGGLVATVAIGLAAWLPVLGRSR